VRAARAGHAQDVKAALRSRAEVHLHARRADDGAQQCSVIQLQNGVVERLLRTLALAANAAGEVQLRRLENSGCERHK
jgi:hypothetical protein